MAHLCRLIKSHRIEVILNIVGDNLFHRERACAKHAFLLRSPLAI